MINKTHPFWRIMNITVKIDVWRVVSDLYRFYFNHKYDGRYMNMDDNFKFCMELDKYIMPYCYLED